ncbi:MAG: UbiA family prenyltransferase [Chitinispirillaceae bacterium]|nr:UbiA family prenyltransferase [Chitinispirillaceae bacterium]
MAIRDRLSDLQIEMKPSSVLDTLMATRPVLLIPVWGFSALGYRCATGSSLSFRSLFSLQSSSPSEYLILIVFSFSVAAVYLFNQLADIEVDKKNGGLPLVASGIVTVPSAIITAVFLSIAALILPLPFHLAPITACSAAALLLGAVYSFRPFRFSGRPFLDFISNAMGYGVIAYGAGWYVAGKTIFSIEFSLHALPYFLLMCAGSISSTLPDIEGDRSDGKITTAVQIGFTPAHLLAMLLLITAGIAGFFVNDGIAVLCSLGTLPFYLAFLLWPHTFLMEATYKIGGAFCMIAAFISMPGFIPVSVIVFTITWLYFRIRHGITYPSLLPANKP